MIWYIEAVMAAWCGVAQIRMFQSSDTLFFHSFVITLIAIKASYLVRCQENIFYIYSGGVQSMTMCFLTVISHHLFYQDDFHHLGLFFE